MKKVGYTITTIFLLLIVWILIFGPERYFIFNPYIDTEMAPNYSVESFETIKIGDYLKSVEKKIGKPLSFKIEEINQKRYYYTSDGKLYNSKVPFYMYSDYAWYRSSLTFDTNNIVIKIDKGWSYD